MLRLFAIAMAMFIGMGFVVPQKAEAGYVRHYVYHRDMYYPNGGERGLTGGYYNPLLGRVFRTNRFHWHQTDWLGNVKSGTYYAGATMLDCRARDWRYVRVSGSFHTFRFYPPDR